MRLSLRQARLCLDCDCLTDELFCPVCDRDGTVPMAGWFRPIDDGKPEASRQAKTLPPVARRWLIVVQHHQRDLYRVLRQALAGTGVEVLYERRIGPRRRTAKAPSTDERRRTERRRPRPSAVVYPDAAARVEPESAPRSTAERETERIVRPPRRHTAPV
jgi:hypothetical protein